MNTKHIRILLADDHVILREGLIALFEHFDDIEVIGEANSGQEAIEKVKTLQPDVVIMDIAMPGMNGLEASQVLTEQFPQTRVLVLSQHEEPQLAMRIVQSGVAGFIPKHALGAELVKAIRRVANNETCFHPSITEAIINEMRICGSDKKPGLNSLTKREKEVLRAVALGKTNAQIAAELSLKVKTVEWHRANIMEKLDLHNVADLVRYALTTGVVDMEISDLAQR